MTGVTAVSNIPQLLVHDQEDNVGVVVVEGLKAGTDMLCVVTHDNSSFRLKAETDVPIGHKIALRDVKAGETAIKYGEDIGEFKSAANKGEHIHTHNCKTKRW
jgi:(2R)-sulfolactate sulfo-lyase subunit alpha